MSKEGFQPLLKKQSKKVKKLKKEDPYISAQQKVIINWHNNIYQRTKQAKKLLLQIEEEVMTEVNQFNGALGEDFLTENRRNLRSLSDMLNELIYDISYAEIEGVVVYDTESLDLDGIPIKWPSATTG